MQSKAMKTIKSNSGASLIFVIAVMMMLMIIATSTLVASGANAGAGASKREANQLNMYADSIQKSIMYGLQESDSDTGKNIVSATDPVATLGGQILRTLYNKALDAGGTLSGLSLDITTTLSDADLSPVTSVNIRVEPEPSSGSMDLVEITPFKPAQPPSTLEGVPLSGSPRVPQNAAIQGLVTVTVTAAVEDRIVVSVVRYNLQYAYLEDDGVDETNMIIHKAGEWGFVSHEKADR